MKKTKSVKNAYYPVLSVLLSMFVQKYMIVIRLFLVYILIMVLLLVINAPTLVRLVSPIIIV